MDAQAGGLMPPCDLAAEASVLAAMMLDPAVVDDVAGVVAPGDFHSQSNAAVARAIFALREANAVADVVTVAHWLRDNGLMASVGAAYLGELLDSTPAVANVRAHAEIVGKLAAVRLVIRTCQIVAAEGYHQLDDVSAWLERVEATVYKATRGRSSHSASTMADVMADTFDHLRRVHDRAAGEVLRSTGLRNLDRIIAGLIDGDLIIEAGRPGMGKTSLLYEHALAVAAAGEHVAIFSLEMPELQVGQRLVAMKSSADLGRMRRGHMSASDWEGATAAGADLAALPIHIDDRSSVSVLDVRAGARRVAIDAERKGQRLGLVGVDYLQLMSGTGGEPSREQEVAGISRGLKQLAKDLSVPVVALSQLNRTVESTKGNRPTLSHLRESGAIEQDADTVILMYREGYYLQQAGKDDTTGGATEAIVAKQRNGPTGIARLRFYSGNASFGDAEQHQERATT